jgi:endonuclease/exonuclease/phosphatase family metal-dependent hydrolase
LVYVLGLAVSLVWQQPTRAESPESRTLRVVHWNVFYDGKGTDGIRNRSRQVTVLAGLNADVITLNEVTANATVDYAVQLERATGVHWNHHHGSKAIGGWGNAILTRHPLVSTSVYKVKIGASRNVTQATIDVNGSQVNVFATHLDCCDRPGNRALQVKEILPFLERFAAPRILTGDMNAGPNAAEIQPFSVNYDDAWQAAVDGRTARAYPSNAVHRYTRTRRARLDYIYASKDLAVQECAIPDLRDLSNTNVVTLLRTSDDYGVRPSDHNLVSCVLSWNAPAAPENPDPPGEDPADPDPTDPGDTDGPPPDTDDPGDTDNPPDPEDPGDTENPPEPEDPGDEEDPGDTENPEDPGGGNGETDPTDPDGELPPTDPCNPDAPPAPEPQLEATPEPQLEATPEPTSHDNIVLRAAAATVGGNWLVERDCSAAGSARLVNPDMSLPRARAAAEPVDYFDLTFNADAGKPYRLWMRAKAADDNWRNDSVSVQFSGAVDARGLPVYRIGTEDRTLITLEDCISCGMSGWGWQDNGFGAGVLGPEIYFDTTGPQTIRFQRREDGISIDQIVLSATTWLAVAPGPTKDDSTILPVR